MILYPAHAVLVIRNSASRSSARRSARERAPSVRSVDPHDPAPHHSSSMPGRSRRPPHSASADCSASRARVTRRHLFRVARLPCRFERSAAPLFAGRVLAQPPSSSGAPTASCRPLIVCAVARPFLPCGFFRRARGGHHHSAGSRPGASRNRPGTACADVRRVLAGSSRNVCHRLPRRIARGAPPPRRTIARAP